MRLWIVALLISTFSFGGCIWVGPRRRSAPPAPRAPQFSDAYDARLSAAKGIMSMGDQCEAFKSIALAAADDGRADVVKRALGGMMLMSEQADAASQSALKLADVGKLSDAVAIAKGICLIDIRNETLRELAERP